MRIAGLLATHHLPEEAMPWMAKARSARFLRQPSSRISGVGADGFCPADDTLALIRGGLISTSGFYGITSRAQCFH